METQWKEMWNFQQTEKPKEAGRFKDHGGDEV